LGKYGVKSAMGTGTSENDPVAEFGKKSPRFAADPTPRS